MPISQTPVILIGGASGSGKSYLAARYGRPHLPLDDFYRQISEDGSDDPFPRTGYGEIDWDHPHTWNRQAALSAVIEVLETGSTLVPNYSISTSSYTGHRRVSGPGPVISEGIFLAELLEPLRAAGVNVSAYYINESAPLTALRRFVRDVRERRKSIPFLLRRGYALFRTHRADRRLYESRGFTIISKQELKRLLARLTADSNA